MSVLQVIFLKANEILKQLSFDFGLLQKRFFAIVISFGFKCLGAVNVHQENYPRSVLRLGHKACLLHFLGYKKYMPHLRFFFDPLVSTFAAGFLLVNLGLAGIFWLAMAHCCLLSSLT